MYDELDLATLVEVSLPDEDAFLKIKETLTRIGVSSKHKKALFQSCHILHKRGKYYILMFKELFKLDGKPANISESDLRRRNTIIRLLEEWGLLTVVNREQITDQAHMSQLKIIPYSQKEDWELISKYTVGRKGRFN